MIYFVCAVSAVLFAILRRIRQQMETQQRTRTFSFLLVDNALSFLRPFVVVTLFYVVLSLIVNGGYESTVEVLRKYERLLDSVKNLLKQLKLTPSASLFVLIIAFVLALVADAIAILRPYKARIERLHSFLEKYHKWIGRITTVVTLLASFTFFGGTVSRERARLEIAIKDMCERGEELHNTLEEELRTRVADDILRALPSAVVSFQPLSTIHEEIDRKYDEFIREKQASAEYRIESPATEALLTDVQSRKAKIEVLAGPAEITTPTQKLPERQYEGLISKPKLSALQKETTAFAGRSARLAKEAFETPLGNRVGVSILKMLISERHIPALEALTSDIPIAGPLLSILTDSVRKKTSMLISDATNSIAAASFEPTPPSLRTAIDATVNDVTAVILTDISGPNASNFGVEEALGQTNLAQLDAAERDFHARLENEKTLIRERNRLLVQRLRTTKTATPSEYPAETMDFMPDRRRWNSTFEDLPALRLDLRPEEIVLVPNPSAQPSKFDRALGRLIDKAEQVEDPFRQNRRLNAIMDVMSRVESFEKKAASLAKVAAFEFGDDTVAESFKEIVRQRDIAAGRGPTLDRPRDPVQRRFERIAEPVRVQPRLPPRMARP